MQESTLAKRTCSILGCGKPHLARGWCSMHYRRWRLEGDPGEAELRAPRYAPGADAKICSRCREAKPLAEFPKDSIKPLGVGSFCQPCYKQYQANWRAANPDRARGLRDPVKRREARRLDYARHREKRLAQSRRWAVANPARVAETRRRYHETDPERTRRQAREWRLAHPVEVAERQRRDRAHKKTTAVARITPAQLAAKMAYWGGECWLCGDPDPRTWDHVKPQTRGGPHILANLRPACLSCNTRKHNRWPFPTSPTLARRHPLIVRAH